MEEKDQNVIEDEESLDDLDFDDFEDVDDSEESTEPKKQSREENHEQAKARRERERVKRETELNEAIEKARKEGYEKARREANLENNKINTFTGKPISDEYDLKVYQLQKKIEEEGGDPINDLPSRVAELNRNRSNEEEQKKAEAESVQKQVAEFKTTFPDVDYNEILAVGSPFRDYATGKMGGEKTISQLYKEYLEFASKIVEKHTKEQEELEGKKKSSSPSSTGTKPKGKKSVSEMSDDEIYENWVNRNGSF